VPTPTGARRAGSECGAVRARAAFMVNPALLAAGDLGDLHSVYGGLGSGRLVIAGPPGSGKTGAAVLLLLAALRRRAQAPGAPGRGSHRAEAQEASPDSLSPLVLRNGRQSRLHVIDR